MSKFLLVRIADFYVFYESVVYSVKVVTYQHESHQDEHENNHRHYRSYVGLFIHDWELLIYKGGSLPH